MNLNCVPVVLLVALCWMSVGTYAATNTTTMATNTTTSNANATTAMASNNATSAPATTNSNATSGSNMTTAGSNMTTAGSNMTTAGSNMTTAGSNMTTAGSNMTTAGSNVTTAGSNVTTAGSNVTTTTAAATTTTAPPIETNTTVTTLVSNISKAGCGTVKLCAAEPADCDPSSSNSCFLLGIKRISGRNMMMELAGKTDGYVAAVLKPANGGNDTIYICAKNSSTEVIFLCAYRMGNGSYKLQTCPVNKVKAKVTGNGVQCSFYVTVPSSKANTKASDTMFALGVATGTYNASTGELGTPTLKIQTPVLDLTNPNANTDNTITTTVAPTTAGAITLQQSVSQAFLIILGVMSLAWL